MGVDFKDVVLDTKGELLLSNLQSNKHLTYISCLDSALLPRVNAMLARVVLFRLAAVRNLAQVFALSGHSGLSISLCWARVPRRRCSWNHSAACRFPAVLPEPWLGGPASGRGFRRPASGLCCRWQTNLQGFCRTGLQVRLANLWRGPL